MSGRNGRTGHGRAHGAVTILNGTATGVGCALAAEGGVAAEWTWRDGPLAVEGAPDDRLVRAVHAHLTAALPGLPTGAAVRTRSRWGPARGLKTSSAAAAALLRAARDAADAPVEDAELAREAVAVSRAAGVTLTGAYDDQLAVVLGGCRLADSLALHDLGALPVPASHVAVWVPDAHLDKVRLRGLDPSPAVAEAKAALALARGGRVAEAMTRNGAAFARLYAARGLPVDPRPAEVALAAGALGAGLSGTGPAVAALFEDRVDLPPVPGGRWEWTRTVEAAA